MTLDQLTEWEAYYTINPPESVKMDYRMAQLMSINTNLMIRAYGKKGAQLTTLTEFLLEWDYKAVSEKKQTTEEMKAFLLQFAKDQNRRVAKEKEKKDKLKKSN